jgi:hypothetical protein
MNFLFIAGSAAGRTFGHRCSGAQTRPQEDHQVRESPHGIPLPNPPFMTNRYQALEFSIDKTGDITVPSIVDMQLLAFEGLSLINDPNSEWQDHNRESDRYGC